MQPWHRAGVDALTRTVGFGVATTLFAAFNGKPLGPWLTATAVVGAVQCVLQWRRHSRSKTPLLVPAWSWKALLPWVGLAVAFTSDRWFSSVYRVVPRAFWVVLMIVATLYGVWRWVAFFMNSASKP
jgi:hypothetical protein